MSLKEIFKRKAPYDPVHAHVPGVDEEQSRLLIEEYFNRGDPMPKKPEFQEETIFKLPGIRLVRKTRSN